MLRALLLSSVLSFLLLGASCNGTSGVLVATSWPAGLTVDELDLDTTVQSGSPQHRALTSPSGPAGKMPNPYRVLIESPPGSSVDVMLSALGAGQRWRAAT